MTSRQAAQGLGTRLRHPTSEQTEQPGGQCPIMGSLKGEMILSPSLGPAPETSLNLYQTPSRGEA